MSIFHAREDGSIPMVLTVVILVGGVVAALVGTVIGTQRSVNFDRQHSEAVTIADAGLQQALTYLAQRPATDPIGFTVTSASLPAAAGDSLGSGSFEWTATKAGPLRWEVRSSGVVAGRTRVVESIMSAPTEFFVAAFADQGITFQGNQTASSYPTAGNGTIGSNNAITMSNGTMADFIQLYGSSASCTGGGCSSGSLTGFDDALDMDAIRAGVQAKHAACTSFSAWTASTYDTDGDGVVFLDPGQVICASQVEIDRHIQITGGGDQANPVQFMVTGRFNTQNDLRVNCDPCVDKNQASSYQPISGALRVYTTGTEVLVGNSGFLGAAFLAPDALCAGGGNGNGNGGSGAQTHVYGSMICETMGNQGGWAFHYDEALLGLGSGRLDILSYREESTATTSFTP